LLLLLSLRCALGIDLDYFAKNVQYVNHNTMTYFQGLDKTCSEVDVSFVDWIKHHDTLQFHNMNKKFFNDFDSYAGNSVPTIKYSESILKLLAALNRHWSVEGAELRDGGVALVMQAVKTFLEPIPGTISRIVIPGGGLCRVPFEIAQIAPSYHVEVLESDKLQYQLADFILNGISEYELYPAIYTTSNWVEAKHRFQKMKIPEFELSGSSSFSLIHGSFPEHIRTLSSHMEAADAVITHFFYGAIDPMIQMKGIYDLLSSTCKEYDEGGNCIVPQNREKRVWINYGPLIFPYRSKSLHLSYE